VLGLIPQALIPGAEWAQRLVGAFAGVGLVVAAWWAARTLGGPVAGIVAAAALAAASPLQVESASFLTDAPSTLVLLLVAMFTWRHVRGPGPIGPSFAWVGLIAALAFYLRYGALVELTGIAAAAVVAPRRLIGRWRSVAAALTVFAIALVPHFAVAVLETGAPWGIVAAAGRAAGGGDGWPMLSYIRWFPWRLIGPLGAAVALIGILACLRHAGDWPLARFIGVAALVPILVLGTVVHAEPRYMLFPMTLLVVLGSVEVAGYLERHPIRPALKAAVAGLIAASLVLAAAFTAMEIRNRAETFDWKRDVGSDIGVVAETARAPNCSILTADVPIMSWYSGCHAVNFVTGGQPDRVALLAGRHRFVVVSVYGPHEPAPDVLAELVRDAEIWGRYVDGQGRPAAVVYRLPEP
jgi:4-amino-4-deoxy-L-arabinose transferase-like glycosyltransferase